MQSGIAALRLGCLVIQRYVSYDVIVRLDGRFVNGVQSNSHRLMMARDDEGTASYMLTTADRALARKLKQRIAAIVPVLDLIVFGSRARGGATSESDLDVFVLVEHLTPGMRRRISEVVWEVGYQHDQVVTTVVATTAQVAGMFGASPLWRNICSDGIRP